MGADWGLRPGGEYLWCLFVSHWTAVPKQRNQKCMPLSTVLLYGPRPAVRSMHNGGENLWEIWIGQSDSVAFCKDLLRRACFTATLQTMMLGPDNLVQ
jgi:hypothetical protein